MSNLEKIKWLGAVFILVSPVMAYFQMIPLNFLILSFGIAIWAWVGYKTKDRPMFMLNVVSVILNLLAYINN